MAIFWFSSNFKSYPSLINCWLSSFISFSTIKSSSSRFNIFISDYLVNNVILWYSYSFSSYSSIKVFSYFLILISSSYRLCLTLMAFESSMRVYRSPSFWRINYLSSSFTTFCNFCLFIYFAYFYSSNTCS